MKVKQKCPRTGCNNPAIIDSTFGVLPCQKCQDEDSKVSIQNAPEIYTLTKLHRIQEQRDKYDGDMLQPWLPGKDNKPNPDFVKAYPDVVKNYFTDEQLSKL